MVCGNLEAKRVKKPPGLHGQDACGGRLYVVDNVRKLFILLHEWTNGQNTHTEHTRDGQLQKHNRQNKTSKYNQNVDS